MGILGVTVDGVFADRVVVPARSCFALPDEIGSHVGALLEPAGSAMHSVLRSGVDLAGASVLVTGAGPVGLVTAQILVALVVAGSVDLELLVTHRLPLSRLPVALDLMRSEAAKVLLIPAMPDERLNVE
jgi:threonine dehydrogenase-like Zn-dependent dehydrogenase